MKSALVLFFYLSDQLISGALPFSSGPFAVALVLICWRRSVVTRRMTNQAMVAAALLLVFGITGGVLSGSSVSAFFVASSLMLVLMWTVGAGLHGQHAVLVTPKGALVGVAVSTLFLLLSALGWDITTNLHRIATNRGAGLFIEPSHYALYVMPLWLIAFQVRRYRPLLYAALAIAVLWCFSATLVAWLVIAGAVKFYFSTGATGYSPRRFFGQFVTGSLCVAAAYVVSGYINVEGIPLQTYLTTRAVGILNAGDPAAANISSLVVVQGVELARISLVESRGFGVGLGNFGLSEQIIDQSAFRSAINSITTDSIDLNLRDGGLLINKLAGELGLLALAIPLLLYRGMRRTRAEKYRRSHNYHAAMLIGLLCLLLIRALPYFHGPACLAIFSIAALINASSVVRPRNARTQRPALPHLAATSSS